MEAHRGKFSKMIRGLALAALFPILSGCLATDGGGERSSAIPARAPASGAITDPAVSEAASSYTAMSAPGNAAYRLGPLDTVDVSVFKVPELTRTVQVSDTGNLNFPLVGNVAAAGRTSAEIERDLARKLDAGYVKSPQVTVFVRDYNSQRFAIEGSVKKPGVYAVRGNTTLLDAIAMGGGIDDYANSSDIIVLRRSGEQKMAARFNLEDIRDGRSTNPTIQAGDVIAVAESGAKRNFDRIIRMLPALGTFALLI